MTSKFCPCCKKTLDLNLFGVRNEKPSPYCLSCTRIKTKARYHRDFKKIAARKHAKYVLNHPIKKTHVYIPLKMHPPLGTVLKRCEKCHTTLYVCPESKNETCGKCGASYDVKKTLSDTRRTRGGFKLVPSEPVRALYIPEVLTYIQAKGETYITQISNHFGRPRSTVRNYIRVMETEGLVSIEMNGGYANIRLTSRGVSELSA